MKVFIFIYEYIAITGFANKICINFNKFWILHVAIFNLNIEMTACRSV